MAARFKVPAIYHLDYLLAREDIEAISALTPSGMHPHHAITVAKASKHVIVEKPMALRLEDADAMIRACDEAGVKLFVVSKTGSTCPWPRRWRPTASAASCWVPCGCAGAATMARKLAYDGGVLSN
jgi:hypothetical protein